MGIALGTNQYGKAEVRVVTVDRSSARHVLRDLNVSCALRGDFTAVHLDGDNAHVLATDTQRNTVYAFAREGIGEIEEFGLRLARHFAGAYEWLSGARVEIEEYGWDRITVGGAPHDHAFSRTGAEVRTTVVTVDGADVHVISGLSGLVVLKTTESGFAGFPRDRYTTLADTDDRILATAVTARWRYTAVTRGTEPNEMPISDYAASYASIRSTLLATFAAGYSSALQETLYSMGQAVLEAHPAVAEIRLSMPNKHHFLSDLAPFGLDNPGVVYSAADRPYGLIEGTVVRDDIPSADLAWRATPGFC
ncbi:MAG: urate oxidase [Geodermatophilaceae bacterium]|nr:urate oxidase [Geodermatophilaceae bacterium]